MRQAADDVADESGAITNAIDDLSESLWGNEDEQAAREHNREQVMTIPQPPLVGDLETFPRVLQLFLGDTVGLWSAHFHQNGKELGGGKDAYCSGGRSFFKRGGDPMPLPFSMQTQPLPNKKGR